ncbi:hypothetical protein TELCIR_05393 [Teladorsagia circumcincta]|uniref:Tetraspanin family protein n=1 Tax=Teladorsagia circumcincta TaxID=45464 RepID=A0A2G9UQY2_TELCI|nr:hypothetical protein TELCIR_05393 [Teladorsagia circumcincta]
MRCLLVGFMVCLFFLFLADVSIGTLALVYRNKFAQGRLTVYIKNMTHNRYNRDAWVKPLLDTVQFYVSVYNLIARYMFYLEECCGVSSSDDYLASRWMALVASDPSYEHDDPPLVPLSCCRQIIGASALNPVARSLARCQQAAPNKMWRHTAVSSGIPDLLMIARIDETA